VSIVKVIRLKRREGLRLYWAALKQFWKLYRYARGTGRDRREALEFTAIAARSLRMELRTKQGPKGPKGSGTAHTVDRGAPEGG